MRSKLKDLPKIIYGVVRFSPGEGEQIKKYLFFFEEDDGLKYKSFKKLPEEIKAELGKISPPLDMTLSLDDKKVEYDSIGVPYRFDDYRKTHVDMIYIDVNYLLNKNLKDLIDLIHRILDIVNKNKKVFKSNPDVLKRAKSAVKTSIEYLYYEYKILEYENRFSKRYTIADQEFRNFVKDVCKALYAENIPYVIVGNVAFQLHLKQNNFQDYPTNKVVIKVKADPAKVKEVIAKYNLGKIEDGGLRTIYVEQPRFYASIYCRDELPPAEEVEIEGVNVSVKELTLLLAEKIYRYKWHPYPNEKNLKDMTSLLQVYIERLEKSPQEERDLLYKRLEENLKEGSISYDTPIIKLSDLIKILKTSKQVS